MRWYLLLLPFLLLISKSTFAFDPFTIATVVSSVANIAGSASTSGTSQAIAELYGELDTDARMSDSGQKMVDNIQHIDQMINEIDYNVDEIADLANGNRSYYNTFADDIGKVTKALRAAKRIGRMFSPLDKRAQVAQIESTEIQKQQLATLDAILMEEQNHSLDGLRNKVQEALDKKRESEGLKIKLSRNGIMRFKSSKITTFPLTSGVLESAIQTSEKLKPILFGILFVIFAIRILYYQVKLDDYQGYLKLLKDSILATLLLGFYPDLLRFILTCTQEIATFSSTMLGHATYNIIDPKEFKPPEISKGSWWTSISFEHAYQWLIYCAYAWAKFWMTIGLAIMILGVPIVMVLSIMLGFSLGWQAYLGLFIIVGLWPTMWNLIGVAGELLWGSNADPLECAFNGFFLSIFQCLSPLFVKKLLHGQSPTETVHQSAGLVSQVIQRTHATGGNLGQAISSNAKGESSRGSGVAGALGGVAGYGLNQAASRSMNAARSMTETQGSVGNKIYSGVTSGLMNNSKDSSPQTFLNGFKKQKLGGNTNAKETA